MPETKIKSLTTLSDADLIKNIRDGEIEQYSEIVRRYNQRFYRIALSYGINDDDCEEVIQLAYISGYKKLNQFRGEAKFSTWLIRILINECLMLKRKQKRLLALNEERSVIIPAQDHLNPESNYMAKERKEILKNAIMHLPEKYRSVIILTEIEGMSVAEVSEALTISTVNVKVRHHRAKTMLRKLISDATDISDLLTFGNERCSRVNNKVMEYIRQK